jgi:hypothetical protein
MRIIGGGTNRVDQTPVANLSLAMHSSVDRLNCASVNMLPPCMMIQVNTGILAKQALNKQNMYQ